MLYEKAFHIRIWSACGNWDIFLTRMLFSRLQLLKQDKMQKGAQVLI